MQHSRLQYLGLFASLPAVLHFAGSALCADDLQAAHCPRPRIAVLAALNEPLPTVVDVSVASQRHQGRQVPRCAAGQPPRPLRQAAHLALTQHAWDGACDAVAVAAMEVHRWTLLRHVRAEHALHRATEVQTVHLARVYVFGEPPSCARCPLWLCCASARAATRLRRS